MKRLIYILLVVFTLLLTSCDYELFNPFITINNQEIGLDDYLSDVRITNEIAHSETPSLVWNGYEYGMCWKDDRNGFGEIYFTRINSSGNKIVNDIAITFNNDVHYPVLVWTGTEYGLCWQDYRDGNEEIYFARIDSLGNKIGLDVRITNDINNSLHPSLVWTGSQYGVSWYDDRDGNDEIYFARIDSSGNKVGLDVRISDNDSLISNNPSLAWNGTEFGVCWYDERDGYEIYFSRINNLGNKIGLDIAIDYDLNGSNYPSLVWNGTRYGISWRDWRDGNEEIYFAEFDSLGNKTTLDVRVTDNLFMSSKPSLVWTGIGYGVSWEDTRDVNYEIYFAILNSSGIKQ